MRLLTIYTDGSCRPNPGLGGWGVVILEEGAPSLQLKGREEETTNNRMELTAVIKALQSLTSPCRVDLYTDSRYVKDGITSWLEKWQLRNWSTIEGTPVKNQDLWQELALEVGKHTIRWHWVKGHSGDQWNNLADELASLIKSELAAPVRDDNSVNIFLGITWRQQLLAGSWAAILNYRNHYKVIGAVQQGGTANSLHIVSAVGALHELTRQLPVNIYTTSGYLRDGARHWLQKWQARGWQTSSGEEVSNKSQWQLLASTLQQFPAEFYVMDKENPPCQMAEAKELAKEFLLV